MSVDAAIFVYDGDGWDGTLASRVDDDGRAVSTEVIRTSQSIPLSSIITQIVGARSRLSSEARVKLTILAHGYEIAPGQYGIGLGTGIAFSNLSDLDPLSGLFAKVVSRACGPIDPAPTDRPVAAGRSDPLIPSMQRFYTEFARRVGATVVAGEQQQAVNITTRGGVMRTVPWIGIRWAYSTDGSRRGILSGRD